MVIKISNEYAKALRVIDESYYDNGVDLGKTVEEMIDDYLTREHGRLGIFINGKFIERKEYL